MEPQDFKKFALPVLGLLMFSGLSCDADPKLVEMKASETSPSLKKILEKTESKELEKFEAKIPPQIKEKMGDNMQPFLRLALEKLNKNIGKAQLHILPNYRWKQTTTNYNCLY